MSQTHHWNSFKRYVRENRLMRSLERSLNNSMATSLLINNTFSTMSKLSTPNMERPSYVSKVDMNEAMIWVKPAKFHCWGAVRWHSECGTMYAGTAIVSSRHLHVVLCWHQPARSITLCCRHCFVQHYRSRSTLCWASSISCIVHRDVAAAAVLLSLCIFHVYCSTFINKSRYCICSAWIYFLTWPSHYDRLVGV